MWGMVCHGCKYGRARSAGRLYWVSRVLSTLRHAPEAVLAEHADSKKPGQKGLKPPKRGGVGRQGKVNAENRAGRRGKDHANPPAKRQLRGCDRAAV